MQNIPNHIFSKSKFLQKSTKKNLFIYFASISLLFFSTKPISSDEFNLEWSDSYTSPTTTIQGSIEFDPDNFRSQTQNGTTGISNLDSFSLSIGDQNWDKNDLTYFAWTDRVGLDFTKELVGQGSPGWGGSDENANNRTNDFNVWATNSNNQSISGRYYFSLRGPNGNNWYLTSFSPALASNIANGRLANSNLASANLNNSNLNNANLSRATLTNANLSSATLTNANLANANLSRATLTNANLSRAALTNANLASANLQKADLKSAKLKKADLSSANLNNSKLKKAVLSPDINITKPNINIKKKI